MMQPPEKILLESLVRALQIIVNAVKHYSKVKYPSKEDPQ